MKKKNIAYILFGICSFGSGLIMFFVNRYLPNVSKARKKNKIDKVPLSNITKEERQAIKTLKADKEILILPADKGRSVVLLDKSEYNEKCEALLSDTSTYKRERRDPTAMLTTKIINHLKDLKQSGAITWQQYSDLYPTMAVTPKFYCLPKIHKPDTPLRPIVVSCGSITYNIAKHVAWLLRPLVGKTDHHIKNSLDLVQKLSLFKLEEDESLISFDVKSLFTNVPVEESVDIMKNRLEKDSTLSNRTNLSAAQVACLLHLCLTTTYFTYNGNFYTQVEGAAMGSPVSPIVANLFMEHFEERALDSVISLQN